MQTENSTNNKRAKPTDICPHGKECNRKFPHHFMEYAHEHLEQIIEKNPTAQRSDQYQIPDDLLAQKNLILDQIKIINDLFRKQSLVEPHAKRAKSSEKVSLPPSDSCIKLNPNSKMAEKLAAAHPYNFFLTRVQSSPQTHNEPLSITFAEIFDESLGDLECSVQINFVVDPNFVLDQYLSVGHLNKPLLILYGRGYSPELEEMSGSGLWEDLTTHFVQMPLYATHHTKMMLLGYKNGSMRVVVSTANLYEPDWHNRTQGLWISERLDAMPNGSDTAAGESETGFRNDLIKYLSSYANVPKLEPWIQRIRKTNFKSVKYLNIYIKLLSCVKIMFSNQII